VRRRKLDGCSLRDDRHGGPGISANSASNRVLPILLTADQDHSGLTSSGSAKGVREQLDIRDATNEPWARDAAPMDQLSPPWARESCVSCCQRRLRN